MFWAPKGVRSIVKYSHFRFRCPPGKYCVLFCIVATAVVAAFFFRFQFMSGGGDDKGFLWAIDGGGALAGSGELSG